MKDHARKVPTGYMVLKHYCHCGRRADLAVEGKTNDPFPNMDYREYYCDRHLPKWVVLSMAQLREHAQTPFGST